jgi:hypothetical protein
MAGGSLSSKNKLLTNYNEAEPPMGSASFFLIFPITLRFFWTIKFSVAYALSIIENLNDLNLQLAWDRYHVTHSSAVKEIRKIKILPALARAANG